MTAPEKSTKRFSIRLNSEGLCFICLRDCSKVNGGDHSPPTSFRLRNITRFLGIDSKKILKTYLDYDLKRCSDVKVELCEGCSEQVQKFNCLYQTLELTKLKLNECAQKISNLIKEAEEECADDDRTSKMERRVTHAATKGVMVDLRAEISEKCQKVSGTVLPLVILKRLRESEVTKFLCQGGSNPTTSIKIEVPEVDDESRSSTDNDLAASQASDSDTESVISEEEQRTQIKSSGLRILNKSCRRNGKFPCPLCKAVLHNNNRKVKLHLVNYHLQAHFFPEEKYKEPSLSSRQFIEIVTHLLFKDVFTVHPVTESVSRCPHCSKTFDRQHASGFKLHIMKAHKSPLFQRLKQLQKDPMLIKTLLKNTKSWSCKCGHQFSSGKIYIIHRKKFCSLIEKAPNDERTSPTIRKNILKIDHQQINSSQSADGTLRASCPHCRAVFVNKDPSNLKLILEIHLSAFHPHTFFNEEDLKEPSLSSCQFQQVIHHHLFANISKDPRNPNLLKCPNCSVTMTKDKKSRLRVHVIKFHHVCLVQRVKELQNDLLILKRLSRKPEELICKCGVYCPNKKQYKLHCSKFCNLSGKAPTIAGMIPKLSKQNLEVVYEEINSAISKSADGTGQKSCSHCRAVLRTKFIFNLKGLTWDHLVRFHLHIFFPEDNYKDPSLSSHQFKQVIHHFLFQDSTNDSSEKMDCECPHCKRTLKKGSLQLHLLKYHHSSLVQRLEELQRNALIFKQLAKIPKGLSCKCGDYFMSIKLLKLHRKKFCARNGDHVETSSLREIDSSTCNTERDPLELEDDEIKFQADDHFSDSDDLYSSIDVGKVKPSISLGTDVGEEGIGTTERKRRGSELDSDSSSSETNCIRRKVPKLELL